MIKISMVLLLINFVYANNYDVIASCDNAKSEFVELTGIKTDGYEKDSMVLSIVGDKKTGDIYLKVKSNVVKLIMIDKSNEAYQFIEKVASGHSVLYTLFGNQLTIQKSYSFLGNRRMVNTILECK